jgi:hypothetical protein
MRWFALGMVVATMMFLVGCGGSDKVATATSTSTQSGAAAPTTASGATTSAPTTASSAPTTAGAAAEATATTAAPASGGAIATQADPNFPDVHVPLTVGSNGEVPSSSMNLDDLDSTTMGTIKATIVAITDPATTTSELFQPDAGSRYWAVEVKLEATGDKQVNTGQWTVRASDGQDYETVYLTGVGDDIIYGALDAGQTAQGVLVFMLPQDVSVQWLRMNPSVYVGRNLFFDAAS